MSEGFLILLILFISALTDLIKGKVLTTLLFILIYLLIPSIALNFSFFHFIYILGIYILLNMGKAESGDILSLIPIIASLPYNQIPLFNTLFLISILITIIKSKNHIPLLPSIFTSYFIVTLIYG